jgi:hypothetical protein
LSQRAGRGAHWQALFVQVMRDPHELDVKQSMLVRHPQALL